MPYSLLILTASKIFFKKSLRLNIFIKTYLGNKLFKFLVLDICWDVSIRNSGFFAIPPNFFSWKNNLFDYCCWFVFLFGFLHYILFPLTVFYLSHFSFWLFSSESWLNSLNLTSINQLSIVSYLLFLKPITVSIKQSYFLFLMQCFLISGCSYFTFLSSM